MPKKKEFQEDENSISSSNPPSLSKPPLKTLEKEKAEKSKKTVGINTEKREESINSVSESVYQNRSDGHWLFLVASFTGGLLAGVLLAYFILVRPLQTQLDFTASLHDEGVTSSNQIKSDFSNMQLRQQEMEIRYIKAAAQLEIANQYIFLLQMKEKVVFAELMVEQKNGLEARKALADIKSLYDLLAPYILEKDKNTGMDLEAQIQKSIQDLTTDPDATMQDLNEMNTLLKAVETALFRME